MKHFWIKRKIPNEINKYWSYNLRNNKIKFKHCKICNLQKLSFCYNKQNDSDQFVTVLETYYYINNKICENQILLNKLTCEEIIIKNLIE